MTDSNWSVSYAWPGKLHPVEVSVHWRNSHSMFSEYGLTIASYRLWNKNLVRTCNIVLVIYSKHLTVSEHLDWRSKVTIYRCKSFYYLMLLNSTSILTNKPPNIFALAVFLQVFNNFINTLTQWNTYFIKVAKQGITFIWQQSH